MKSLEKKAANKITKSYRALGTVIDLTIYGCQDEGILDQSYQLIKYYEDIFISAGIRGTQMKLKPNDLLKLVNGNYAELF